MLPAFADPRTDFVFKRIFGAEAHKDLLIALLNHLLELEGEQRILAVHHLSRDQKVAVPEMRLSIVDVKCTDATGRRFIVKMQVLNVEGFEKPIVYDASKPYVMLRRNGEQSPALYDVVAVTICNFTIWSAKDAHGSFEVPMLSRWRMQERHVGAKEPLQVQYVFLELPKYAAGDAPQTRLDRWAYFFRETRDVDVVPEALAEPPFREALDVARSAGFTAIEWMVYERAKMAEQDAHGALALARREGFEQGSAEARAGGPGNWRRETLLRLLGRAGIILDEGERARVETCVDSKTLDRWLDNIIGAKTIADVLT